MSNGTPVRKPGRTIWGVSITRTSGKLIPSSPASGSADSCRSCDQVNNSGSVEPPYGLKSRMRTAPVVVRYTSYVSARANVFRCDSTHSMHAPADLARTVRLREQVAHVLGVEGAQLVLHLRRVVVQEREVVCHVALGHAHQAAIAHEAPELAGGLQVEPARAARVSVRAHRVARKGTAQTRAQVPCHFFSTSWGGVRGASCGVQSSHWAYACCKSCAMASLDLSSRTTSSALVHFRLPANVTHTASCKHPHTSVGARARGVAAHIARARLGSAPVELRQHSTAKATDGGLYGRVNLRETRFRRIVRVAVLIISCERAVTRVHRVYGRALGQLQVARGSLCAQREYEDGTLCAASRTAALVLCRCTPSSRRKSTNAWT